MRIYHLAFIIVLCCVQSLSFAQKSIVLTGLQENQTNLVFGDNLDLSPGDTLVVPAGVYGGIRFYDIHGLPGMPITITNSGGQVVLEEHTYSALEFQRSSYLLLSGKGHESTKYGFDIRSLNTGAQGINLANFTTDVEIEHIEVSQSGFAGIMAKTDPNCANPDSFRAAGFVMRNINIHHNKIHHTKGEGIYIGNTGSTKTLSNYQCDGGLVFAHWCENITVSHNNIRNTGLDGIQLNLVRTGGIIRDNRVVNYGQEETLFQDFAMSVGVGSYDIYNNRVINKPGKMGKGMQLLNGFSGSKVFNNLFVNPKLYGIFIHNRHEFEDPTQGYLIANNTIITPELSGIRYNTVITEPEDPINALQTQDDVPTYFVNNLIVNPGNDFEGGPTWKQNAESYIDFNDLSTRNGMLSYMTNNLLTRDIIGLQVKNAEKNNYQPSSYQSPLVDAGTDLSSWGIEFDLKNRARPSGNGFDIGAFELRVRTVPEQRLQKIKTKSDRDYGITVYPNPSPSYFKVSNEDQLIGRLQLFDGNGNKVLRIKDYEMDSEVPISGLDSGTYYLKVTFPDNERAFAQVLIGDE